jgi:oligopeptide transport system permease protein
LKVFVLRRVLWTIPVLLLVILFTFLLVRAIANGPFSAENAPPAIRSEFHFDKPWYEQYAFYVKGVFTLDLGLKLGWFPTSGWPNEHWELDRHVVLPSLTLSLMPMAWFARLLRGSVLETIGQDHVRAARAKGLRSAQIILRHVLKNSLFPLVTVAGPIIGYLITGSFIVEWIFSIPGIGRYFITAAFSRDYFLILGITVVLSVTIIVANLLVDLAYFALDPRTRDARG